MRSDSAPASTEPARRQAAWCATFFGIVLVAQTLAEPIVAQLPASTRAVRYRETGYVALQQAVLDATSDKLVLLVASHPDDRYVLPAAYLRFKLGARVAILLFTRGKGGQNSSGPETGDALGDLRTLESEACASHLGARVYYLNRPDNGYSRSAAETLEEWGEESTVRDLARLIRQIQPDVVMTTHDLAESHGHDLALLRVLPKAVAMSGDPQIEIPGTVPFTVSRLFRGATEEEEGDICISLEMDRRDHARGKTYRELAYSALEEHRSQAPLQAMETLLQPILEMVPVAITSDPAHCTLFEGLPDLFEQLRLLSGAKDLVTPWDFAGLRANLLSLPKLSAAAIALLRRLRAIEAPAGSDLARRLGRRITAVERIIVQSAGVQVFMKVPPGVEAAPGDDMPLQIWLGNEGGHRVTGIRVAAVEGGALRLVGPGSDRTTLEPQESLALEARYRPPEISEGDVRRIFSRDTFEPPLRLRFSFAVDGQPITIEEVIETDLQPAVKLTVTPRTLLLPEGAVSVPFVVGIERKTSKAVDLMLRVKAPAGMRVDAGVRRERMEGNERFREFTFTLKAPHVQPGVSTMHVHVGDERIRVNVHKVDVRVPDDLRVGLIPGVDNTAYEILQALVGDARIEKFEPNRTLPILDRRRLHTIVVDIRSLRSPMARAGFARLLEFVRDGGRLVVFYHKDNEFNIDQAFFNGAPYPLHIGKARVTRQDAPVKVLVPEHALFNFPNKIRSEDWDGWRQERGLYFPEKWDTERYQELLAMNDPGFPQERGALLYARYGAGDYIYCALSLYRQLKNRHAGACRLFANMISPRTR